MPLARWQASVLDDAGNVVADPVIDVLREGDGARPSLFSDREGATAIGNPFTGESDGYVSFHVIGGAYRITATKGAFSRTWRYAGIGTAAESDLPLSTLFNPSGLWSAVATYAQNDLVQWGGGSFISNDNDNLDNEPLIAPLASNEFWTWVATPNDNVAGAIQFAESDLDGDGPIVVDGENKMAAHVKDGLVEFWGGLGSWTLKLLRAQLMATGYGLAPSGAHRDAETFANMASRLTYAIPKISDAVEVSDDEDSDETQVSMDIVGTTAVCVWASRLLSPGTTYITRIRRKSVFSSAWDGLPEDLFDRLSESPSVNVYPAALKTDRNNRLRQHGIFQEVVGGVGRLYHRYSDDLWVTYSARHMVGDGSELVWSGGDLIQLPSGRLVVPTYNDAMTVASVHVCDDPDGRGWSMHSTIADEASTGATSTNEAALCIVPELNMVFAAVRTHDEIGADTEPLFRSISIDDLESDDAATWTVLPDGTWNGKGRTGLYAPGGGGLVYTDRSHTPSARYAIGRKSLNGAQTWSEQYTIDIPTDDAGTGGQTAAAPIGNGTWLMLLQSHGIIKARNFTDEPQDTYPVTAPGDATVTMAIGTPGEVTDTNHHLAASTPVLYTTTGAVLTGVPAVIAYVKPLVPPDANKYNLSATPGGAAIAFSGTQSGVHTRHAFTASAGTLSAVSAKVHRDRDKVDFLAKFGLTRSGAGTSVLTIPSPERSGDLEGAAPFWRVVVTDDATGAEVGRTAKRGANIVVTVTVADGLNNLSLKAEITL